MLRNIFWKNPLIRIIAICSFVTGIANYVCTELVTGPREEKRRAQEVEVIKRTNRTAVVAEYERRRALKNATVVFETEIGDKIETETVEGPDALALYDAPGPPKNYWGILYGWTAEQIRDADDIPEKIKDWLIRRKVLEERETAYYEKSRANTMASLAASEDESALMLKTWALLSPEQLKFARQEALKTHSAEDVDDFFNELDLSINTTKPERIHRDSQKLLDTHEAYKIVKRELAIEKEAILRERKELNGLPVFKANAHHHHAHRHHDESPCGYDLRVVAHRAEQINAADANRESIRARGYMSAISTDMTVGMVANGILGAGIGAAVGSVAPGMGTAAGAITGFAIGVINGGIGGGVGGAKRHRDARREANEAVARAQKRLDAAREELNLCIRSEATPLFCCSRGVR